MPEQKLQKTKWLSRDVLLICFSAFFADLGYQGVTALFPLFVVLELHEPIYMYGIITAISFGAGSLFAYFGGKAGDKYDKKYVAILGNILIPLMAFSGLTHILWLSGGLFILGWWARYFRTPARRALLVNVSPHEMRAKVFGFLHALDIGGGMLSAFFAILFIWLHIPIGTIILYAAVPLVVSSLLLFFIERKMVYLDESIALEKPEVTKAFAVNRGIFIAMLVAATFYGFSFYNLGFPILTAAGGQAVTTGYTLGVLAYAIYLGVSAVSGYVLGSLRVSPLRSLWLLGYLPSALASALIGASVMLHMNELAFYLFIAVLGLGMGAVETFEPTLTSVLVRSNTLSKGMGWLSVSRSIGQFLSNLIMGILFAFSPSIPYFYAFGAALLATMILGAADLRHARNASVPR